MSAQKTVDVLLLGSGGREHALLNKLMQSPRAGVMWVAPGNGAMNTLAHAVDIDIEDPQAVLDFVCSHSIDLVVIGPEAPLVAGVADDLRAHNIAVFGPSALAAQMEGSKQFAKDVMVAAGVKTAAYNVFTSKEEALSYIHKHPGPQVIKADGLAAGKGVFVCQTTEEAVQGIEECFSGVFGKSGNKVVVEELLQGPECSLLVLTDGEHVLPLATAQDHKRAYDGDTGPNTGGMGVYSPVPIVTDAEYSEMLLAIQKTVATLKQQGIQYSGCLYGGFMLTSDGPYVLEYNARFGDPETQVILPRMQGDLIDIMLRCNNGTLDEAELSWSDNWAVSVVLTSEGYPGSYKKGYEITGIDTAQEIDGVEVIQAGTKLTQDGKLVTDGGRVINVVACAPTFEEAREKAYKAAKYIEYTGKTYRSDIGLKALQGRCAWEA